VCAMRALLLQAAVVGVVTAAPAVTMVDLNSASLTEKIAVQTCAGILNRPEAVSAGVSPTQ
jgi:hypothetical protein